MLNGYKTYLGIIVVGLSYALKDYMSQGEMDTVVNAIMAIAGIVLAVYGRYKATK